MHPHNSALDTQAFLTERAPELSAPFVRALSGTTGLSSAGFPFLAQDAWGSFRDHVSHLLGQGHQAWLGLEQVQTLLSQPNPLSEQQQFHVSQSIRVLRQVIRTASITAPPSLWLASSVIHGLREVGVVDLLLKKEVLHPYQQTELRGNELDTDLCFLGILGVLDRSVEGYSVREGEGQRILEELTYSPGPPGLAGTWADLFLGHDLDCQSVEWLEEALGRADWTVQNERHGHFPCVEEIELGTCFLPVVLGLAMSDKTRFFVAGQTLMMDALCMESNELSAGLARLFESAGVTDHSVVTPLGERVMKRGPGPFGIVEAYHPYLENLGRILRKGTGDIHLTRAANVAASQRANAASFSSANDALDSFCADTGFEYTVFIEHALGRGEAIRQRWSLSGDALTYVGADLEDEAVDAAMEQQREGALPAKLMFVRDADIGNPDCLLTPLRDAGISPVGGVMVVGNGFHEVRQQTDERMIAVFAEYCRAGLVLLFTEETALSIRDQIATAWNTYHPAFRYTHEKSGQGLRPSEKNPPDPFGAVMPLSWIECAEAAGYRCLEKYCRKGRTIFPFPGPDGRNPTTNVTYFFIPSALAEDLHLS